MAYKVHKLEHVIFSDEFDVLKGNNQFKIWRIEKEKLSPKYLQQTNIDDDGKAGIWPGISDFRATSAKVYTENMNRKLCCDVLRKEVKQFSAKTPAQGKMVFEQVLAPGYTSNIVKETIVKLML